MAEFTTQMVLRGAIPCSVAPSFQLCKPFYLSNV
jgi:hypothetical protein